MKPSPQTRSRTFFFFCVALCAVVLTNMIVYSEEIRRILSINKVMDHQIIGFEFGGLDELMKDEEYIGYVSDKNVNDKNGSKEYAQLQYLLAPTIVELDATHYKYTILYCNNEKICFDIAKKVGAKPLRRNQYGVIVTQTGI